MLYEIFYCSHATESFNQSDLETLLEGSRTRNAAHGITGLLCYHKRQFIQLIEGEKEAVTRLFENLMSDERHTLIHILWQGEIQSRGFPDYRMAFIQSQELDPQLRESFSDFLQFTPYGANTALPKESPVNLGKHLLLNMRDAILMQRS